MRNSIPDSRDKWPEARKLPYAKEGAIEVMDLASCREGNTIHDVHAISKHPYTSGYCDWWKRRENLWGRIRKLEIQPEDE